MYSSFIINILFWWSTSFSSFIRLKRVQWQRQCQHSCLLCHCSNKEWLPSLLVAQLSFWNLPSSTSWRFPSRLFCVLSVFHSPTSLVYSFFSQRTSFLWWLLKNGAWGMGVHFLRLPMSEKCLYFTLTLDWECVVYYLFLTSIFPFSFLLTNSVLWPHSGHVTSMGQS